MIYDARGREMNGNGVSLTEKQQERLMAQNATVGEVNQIAHKHASQAMNHLGNQIPAFVQKMVSDAIRGYHDALTIMLKEQHGIELKLPEPPIAKAVENIEERWNNSIVKPEDLPSQESGA